MDYSKFRAFAKGEINESAFRQSLNEGAAPTTAELEEDEKIIQECTGLAMGMVLQSEILDEDAEMLDLAVNESAAELTPYMVGQGLINEATVSITNPRINYVRLNKEAQIKRLKKIIILKLERKAGTPAYKKYKIGTAMKKKNMLEMEKRVGARAERLAKQVWAKTSRNGKVKAKVEEKKAAVKGKK